MEVQSQPITKHPVARSPLFSSSPIFQARKRSASAFPKKRGELTPRRLLRHDSTQIQCLTMDSSPPLPHPKSQLLTEHQEFNERQRNESSVLFEGFSSSSPVLPSTTEDTNFRTPLQSSGSRKPSPIADLQLVAVLPEDDVFPNSSPTPGSKGHPHYSQSKLSSSLSIQALEPYDESEPPSSPPDLTNVALGHRRRFLHNALSNSATFQPATPSEVSSIVEDDNTKGSITLSKPEALSNNGEFHAYEDNQSNLHPGSSPAISQELTNAPFASTNEMRVITYCNSPSVSLPYGAPSKRHRIESQTAQATMPGHLMENPVELQTSGYLASANDAIVDMIPDSFSDELELQIASQLKQDLGLALDSAKQMDTHSSSNFATGLLTKKRKREALNSPITGGKKYKSPRISPTSASTDGEERALGNRTPAKRTSPLSSSADLPSPLPIIFSDYNREANLKERSDGMTQMGRKRKRRRRDLNASKNTAQSPVDSNPSPPKRIRRSLRLDKNMPPLIVQINPLSKLSNDACSDGREASSNRNECEATENSSVKEQQQLHTNVGSPEPHVLASDGSRDFEVQMSATPTGPGEVTEAGVDAEAKEAGTELENINISIDAHMRAGHLDAEEVSSADPGMKVCQTRSVQTENTGSRVKTTGETILNSLRNILSDIKKVTFGKGMLREIDDVMFDIRVETHEAARRHTG
jgi:hypothetical protein